MSFSIPRLHIVFLGFSNSRTTIKGAPARRILTELPSSKSNITLVEYLLEVRERHVADDEALSQSSILNSTIYSSAPDFELLSKTTRIGLLKDGDMLVVVAGAGGRGEIASDPLISDDVELPVSSATAGTRSLADAFKKMDGVETKATSAKATGGHGAAEPVFKSKQSATPVAAQSSAKTKKQEPVNYWVELPKPDGMDQWLETQPPRSASNKKSLQQKHQQQSQPPPPPHKKAPKAPLTPSDDEEVEVEEQEREDEDALSIRSVSTADMRSGRGATASASGSHLQLSHLPPRPPRKKVLLVGINYTGTDAELSGCVNDVKNIYRLVTTRWGYLDTPETMRILTDEHKKDKKKLPTKANILSGLRWLMEDVRAGDKLYFHFSGHGSQQESDGDDYEEDGQDDTLVPLDYKDNGQIVDDDLNDLVCHKLPEGAMLTVFMDCCHSGTILDLPLTYDKNGKFSTIAEKGMQGGSKGLITCISGCMETQTSADAKIAGSATGAMSYSLLKTIQTLGKNITYRQLLGSIRDTLKKKGYSQVPQLSTGKAFDVDQPFEP